jgi:hypothetical protein
VHDEVGRNGSGSSTLTVTVPSYTPGLVWLWMPPTEYRQLTVVEVAAVSFTVPAELVPSPQFEVEVIALAARRGAANVATVPLKPPPAAMASWAERR